MSIQPKFRTRYLWWRGKTDCWIATCMCKRYLTIVQIVYWSPKNWTVASLDNVWVTVETSNAVPAAQVPRKVRKAVSKLFLEDLERLHGNRYGVGCA